MNSKNVKDIRKQLRNVAQEMLPSVLQAEVFTGIAEAIEQRLRQDFGARLEAINDSIMAQLKSMDERSKDVQQFMLNQIDRATTKTLTTEIQLDNTPTDSTTLSNQE